MENKEFCFGEMSIAELMHHATDQAKILVTETVDDPIEDVTEDSLTHYGILGMKWGIRRYQNKDGSLTEAGKKHKRTLEDTISGMTGPNTVLTKQGKAVLAKTVDELYKLDGTKTKLPDPNVDAPDLRETRLMKSLIKDKNVQVTKRDYDDFIWDVEGTDEQHWNEKLSAKNPEHVKKIAKELNDFWKHNMNITENDVDSDDEQFGTHAKNYYAKYLNDPEEYAKIVSEKFLK